MIVFDAVYDRFKEQLHEILDTKLEHFCKDFHGYFPLLGEVDFKRGY